tara:strand:+ start:484 stop:699 length:216 start_codon:yes stop_codon:yes gene_type:complete
MVSFSKSSSPDQERRDAISQRDRYYYKIQDLERQIAKLKTEINTLKNANQEVAYWKDVAETLQEYINIIEE